MAVEGGGWTLWTLHQHFKQIVKNERRAVQTALIASDRALDVAKKTADRAMTKAEDVSAHSIETIALLAARVTILEGQDKGFNSAWGYLVGIAGLGAAAWAAFHGK